MVYDSFDDFARRGSAKLLGAARLLVDDPHTAEDVAQETLIRVYRAWSSIKVSTAVDSYAYRTLIRLASRRRQLARERREVTTAAIPDRIVVAADTDGSSGLAAQVRALLPLLPPRQRDTLVLRFYADLSVESTAQAMHCSVGTVKSQTAKALRRLKELMASSVIDELSQQGEVR